MGGESLVAIRINDGKHDVAEAMRALERIESLWHIGQLEVLAEFFRRAKDQPRIDVRAEARIQRPDQVATVVVRGEHGSFPSAMGDDLRALYRSSERSRSRNGRFTCRDDACQRQNAGDDGDRKTVENASSAEPGGRGAVEGGPQVHRGDRG